MSRAATNRDTWGVDSSPWTHVATCGIDGCSWRGQANTRLWAWRMLSRHLARLHPERTAERQKARVNCLGGSS